MHKPRLTIWSTINKCEFHWIAESKQVVGDFKSSNTHLFLKCIL